MELIGRVKYLTANVCTMLILLYILISNFSLLGLSVFCVSSIILFAGTLLDRKTFDLGISCKVDFYIFISVLCVVGTFMPVVLENIRFGNIAFEFSVLGILSLLAALVLFACSAGVRSIYPGIILKYVALSVLVYGVNAFLDVNSEYLIPCFIFNFLFCLIDIYASKTQVYYYQTWNFKRSKKTFWMAFLICIIILFVNVYLGPNVYRMIYSKYAIKAVFSSIFTPFNVIMFALLMLVTAAVYLYQDMGQKPISLKDSYTGLSIGGLFILSAIYYNFAGTVTLIMLILSGIVLIVFGFSLIRMSPSNPAAVLMGKFIYAPLLFVMIITLFFAFSIVFVFYGYLLPWIVLMCGIILVSVSAKIFNSFWIGNTMRWQMVLIAIAGFLVSIAFAKQTLDNSFALLIITLFISSLSMWALGIRNGIWDNKYSASKVLVCVLMGAVGLLAVI